MEADLDPDELEWMAWQPVPEEEDYFDEGDAADAGDANGVGSPRMTDDGGPEQSRQHHTEQCQTERLSSSSSRGDYDKFQSPGKQRRALQHMQFKSDIFRDPVLLPEFDTAAQHKDKAEDNPLHSSREEDFQPNDHRPYGMANMITGDCVPITGPCGNRVYAKLNQSDLLGTTSHEKRSRSTTKGLLVHPVEVMLEKLESERVQKMFGERPEELPERMPGRLENTDEQLWVEKYAPRCFTDLLSDEQTNREVVRWLKQWDSCVFGHETTTSTAKEVLDALKQNRNSLEGKGSHIDPFGKRKFTPDESLKNHSSSLIYKEGTLKDTHEKVLLLCGPPGLGKTTLAHVAAKHCGYRIVEINASDDRVASTLQNKILDAVQMKSVAGSCQPNCLVIDEIDGAVGGIEGRSAIKQLVDIVTSSRTGSSGTEAQAEDGTTKRQPKRRKTVFQSLARPIICICNDLYAPALRPLRQVARVHMFSRPSTNRVVNRLKLICREEGFKANLQALTTLAKHAESDIRACLNSLQYLKRKGDPLTSIGAGWQMVGSKDMTKTAFDIWGEVLRKIVPSSRTLTREVEGGFSGLARNQLQFLHVYGLITNFGDYELAIDGIYENLLRAGYQDSSLSKSVECLQSICDADVRNHQIHAKQRFFLFEYQPSTMLKIRNLVALPTRPNIQWPRAFQRHKTELAGRRELMISWFNRMSPAIARSLSIGPLALDVVSPLLRILSPSLRPVALQMYSSSEKETMKQLVDSMVCFGITYKTEDNAYAGHDDTEDNAVVGKGGFRFSPPVDVFVKYEGHTSQYRQLPSTICRSVNHEVGIEKIRRDSLSTVKQIHSVAQGPVPVGANGSSTKKRVFSMSMTLDWKQEQQENEVRVGSSTVQVNEVQQGVEVTKGKDEVVPSISVKTVQAVTRQSSSFSDRWKGQGGKAESRKVGVSSDQRQMRPVLYKFHEGFTNAIRRPVLVQEFL